MELAETDLCRLTENIWKSVLGLPVRRTPERVKPTGRTRFLTGCVQITGAWEGAVTLDCSAVLARRIAAIMFGVAPETAGVEDVQDALGEMTNVTGGNIKNLLPTPSHLSLPLVTEGLDYSTSITGGKVLRQVAFDCQGEPLLVSVLERTRRNSSAGSVQE